MVLYVWKGMIVMNSEKLKEIRNIIKDLHDRKILILDLDIIFEIDCQLDRKLSEEDYLKLYNEIDYAYLKLDNISLGTVVYCAINNIDKILNDEDFDLREGSCCY